MCVMHLLFKQTFLRNIRALNVYFLDNVCAMKAFKLLNSILKYLPQSVVLRKVGNQLTFGGE